MSADHDESVSKTNERKYQVFISSTFGDLAEQRRMVLDAVIDRGHIPIALERFPAADSGVPHVIQKAIEASQIYIVILGFRYGAMANTDVSFTHLEYQTTLSGGKAIVVPFLLADEEVHHRRAGLQTQLEADIARLGQLADGIPEHHRLEHEISQLKTELSHDGKLWAFRNEVRTNRFSRPFSLKNYSGNQFDKHMVLAALLEAEAAAAERRVAGWIREPKERELAEAVEAVSQNHFFVDVVRAMSQFDPLAPRVRDQKDEKSAAATFFAEKYLTHLVQNKTSLFFESGSTIAYVAHSVGDGLRDNRFKNDLQISTNNALAYLVFWLVDRIRCSLFPWGLPETNYGAVFGQIDELVPEKQKPSFPPRLLGARDRQAIKSLLDDHYSPARWTGSTLLLGALSGLQLSPDDKAFNCFGPHVGSPRNKIFKRFMYATRHPLMLFMTASKIDCAVRAEHCHFVLEQESMAGDGDADFLSWDMFIKQRPVAFCVGCRMAESERLAARFEKLGFRSITENHKTTCTAIIARNEIFIETLEKGLGL